MAVFGVLLGRWFLCDYPTTYYPGWGNGRNVRHPATEKRLSVVDKRLMFSQGGDAARWAATWRSGWKSGA